MADRVLRVSSEPEPGQVYVDRTGKRLLRCWCGQPTVAGTTRQEKAACILCWDSGWILLDWAGRPMGFWHWRRFVGQLWLGYAAGVLMWTVSSIWVGILVNPAPYGRLGALRLLGPLMPLASPLW
jgi:hypothetical protein